MAEKLNFSLPEKKQKNSITNSIIIVLLLVLIGLSAANLSLRPATDIEAPDGASYSLSAEQTKQLAGKLSQRNLHIRAANLWREYLAACKLSDTERARTLFQVGTLLEKANQYDQAIEYFYRSEIVAELNELKPQINAHIRNCFEKLGKFSALRYELMDRTSLEAAPAAGAKIVAEIGAEKITEADLDGFIESEIENQLEPMAAFMTPEQFTTVPANVARAGSFIPTGP
jgi:tetratricopeptide (TPR) repeat protein